jgi:sigma-B regulation protein RsbU (phosphoserine phosphatase)
MMDIKVFQRFQNNLQVQRENLTDWLTRTPEQKKRARLGPVSEQAVHSHLEVLETAIEKAEDRSLGLCEVCHDYIEPSRLEMDYASCVCLEHLSSEERSRLEFELELSTKVQQALLPQQVADIPGMELAAFSRPAAYVGGDYFDFYRFNDGTPGLVIGDAVGHGLSASLLMASLQASLRILVPDHDFPAEVMRRLNLLFYHNIRMTNFVTLFLARYDSTTRILTYSSAGHNPALLLHRKADRQDSIEWLEPTGAAIGLVEEFEFGEASVRLSPGDILVLYTDGVTEAMNPQREEFGSQRLAELVKQNQSVPAQELLLQVRLRLHEFSQGQPLADDITMVASKIV